MEIREEKRGRSSGYLCLSSQSIPAACLVSPKGKDQELPRDREVGEDTLSRTTQAAVHLRPPLATLSSILRTKDLFSKLELERSCCHQCESPSRPIPTYCAGMLPRMSALPRDVSEAVPWLSKRIMFNFFFLLVFSSRLFLLLRQRCDPGIADGAKRVNSRPRRAQFAVWFSTTFLPSPTL